MSLELTKIAVAAVVASLALCACGDDDSAKNTDDAAVAGCDDEHPCGDGLVCIEDRCVAGGDVDVSIDSSARACEVLIADDGSAQAVSARFGEGVKGSFVRHTPRLALSFVAADDKAVSASDVVPVAVGAGAPKLVKATCIDGKGKDLPKSAFALGGVR